MRENLFRGKKIESGEWVEGYLIKQDNPEYHCYIVVSFKAEQDNRHTDILECDIFEVVPETIGQYTGCCDKNGKKIFEGDILKFRPGTYYPVVYDMDYGAFGSCYFSDFDFLHKYDFKKIEVVGNIYDNPELLRR